MSVSSKKDDSASEDVESVYYSRKPQQKGTIDDTDIGITYAVCKCTMDDDRYDDSNDKIIYFDSCANAHVMYYTMIFR